MYQILLTACTWWYLLGFIHLWPLDWTCFVLFCISNCFRNRMYKDICIRSSLLPVPGGISWVLSTSGLSTGHVLFFSVSPTVLGIECIKTYVSDPPYCLYLVVSPGFYRLWPLNWTCFVLFCISNCFRNRMYKDICIRSSLLLVPVPASIHPY